MANADPVRTWIMAQCGRKALSPVGLGAQVDAGELSEQETLIIVRPFLSAGVDITVSGLSAALSHFACHPRQWRMLCEKPALARQAFEEAIRFGSPVQTFFRTTTREAEVAGIRPGDNDEVLLFLAVANRERVMGKPRYVRHCPPRRRTRRLRRRPFMNALARRWCAWRPNWCSLRATKRVEPFEIAGEPKQRFNNTLRGLVSLPVRVGRALRRDAKCGIQT
jgi:hypothetical protein